MTPIFVDRNDFLSKIVTFVLTLNPSFVFGNFKAHELKNPLDATEFVIMEPKARSAKFFGFLFGDMHREARVLVRVCLQYNEETDSIPSQVKITCYLSAFAINRDFAQNLAKQIDGLGIGTVVMYCDSSFNSFSYLD